MRPLRGLAYLTGICAVAFPVGVYYFFDKAIVRKGTAAVSKAAVDTGTKWENYFELIGKRKEWLEKQDIQTVEIRTHDGLTLKGTWLPAKTDTNKIAIGVHGFRSCGKNDFAALSYFYHELGYHLLLVDNRAHGESDGKYIGFGCLDRKDLVRWIELVLERQGPDSKILLHGISMGGATVSMASGMDLPNNIKGIVSDCAFTSAWNVFSHILKKDYHLPEFPLLGAASKFCKYKAGYAFDECNAVDQVRKTKIPMLFIHGSQDDFVPTRMARELYQACNSKKSLLIVDGADHAESYYYATMEYEKAVLNFMIDCMGNE